MYGIGEYYSATGDSNGNGVESNAVELTTAAPPVTTEVVVSEPATVVTTTAPGPAVLPLDLQFQALSTAQDIATLDMSIPEVAVEVKNTMGLAPFMLDLVFGENAIVNEAFFSNPVWDAQATDFANRYLERFKQANPTADFADRLFQSERVYPTTLGIIVNWLILNGSYPEFDPRLFPNIWEFYAKVNGDVSKGIVAAPVFSGSRLAGFGQNKVALAGLALVGIAGLGILLSRKKR